MGRFRKDANPAVAQAGEEFLPRIINLLQLEMEYDAVLGDAESEERAAVTMKMMNYFMSFEMSRYFRYVHNLYTLHLREDTTTGESINYAEAGTTILLHANQLGWTDEILPELELQNEQPFPEEPSWARKQRLYYLAIEAFNKAKLPERSLDLLKELEVFHTMKKNYGHLKKVLLAMHEAYVSMKSPSRVFSPYFLICYYGTGFTIVYSNKRFVYRADSGDTIEVVADRLRHLFPSASVTINNEGSLDSAKVEMWKKSEGQEIVVLPLRPSCEQETRGEERVFPAKMPQFLKEYHVCNNTDIFLLEDTVSGKKSFLFTEERFPGTRRRLEVLKEICKK